MHERTDLTASPAAIRDAARSAASSDVLAARVAELEQQLASERAHNAGRIREIDSVMRVLRKSMQDLQEEIRRSSAERERLREQLEQTRRNLAAITTGTGPGPDAEPDAELVTRIDALEADLSDARADADAARLERDDLRGRAEELAQEILRRDAALAEVRGRLAAAEARVDELSRAPRAVPVRDKASDAADEMFAERDAPDAADEADSDFIFDTCDPASVEVPRPRAQQPAPQASVVVHGRPSAAASFARQEDADDSVSVGLDDIEPLAHVVPQAAPSMPAVTDPAAASGPELLEDSRTGPIDVSPQAAALAAAPVRPPVRDSRAPAEIAQDPSFPEIPGHRLERLLENGPLGSAYEAREVATRRPVLVRVLPGSLKLFDGKRLDSLLLAKHPNLVGVLSFAVSRAGPYLVMERAEGESVDRWIQRVGPLPERIALAVTLECARGLRQAAFHGALHLDLAPESIFVDAAGKVRVGGVGLRPVLAPTESGARSPARRPSVSATVPPATSGPTSTRSARSSSTCSPAGRRSPARRTRSPACRPSVRRRSARRGPRSRATRRSSSRACSPRTRISATRRGTRSSSISNGACRGRTRRSSAGTSRRASAASRSSTPGSCLRRSARSSRSRSSRGSRSPRTRPPRTASGSRRCASRRSARRATTKVRASFSGRSCGTPATRRSSAKPRVSSTSSAPRRSDGKRRAAPV